MSVWATCEVPHLSQKVCTGEHFVRAAPAYVAMEGDHKRLLDAVLGLQEIEGILALPRALDLR